MRKKKVLITGIGGNTAQGVARSLLEFPDEFELIGTDCDRYNVHFGLLYAKRVYLVPRADNPNYIPAIRKIVEREGIDVIIPSPDPEVLEISRHKDEVGAATLLPDSKVVEISQDKWETYLATKDKGYFVDTILIEDENSIKRAFERFGSPLWIRKRKGAGGGRCFVAHNVEQAKFWVEYWNGYGVFIAAKKLIGRNLSWIGLFKDGELVTSGGYLRIRYFMDRVSPTGVTGNINVGKTIHDDGVNEVAEKMVHALDPRPNGVYTVDLLGDEELTVTEVNSGRFHMSFYIYTKAGINMPYYYVKLALNERYEPPPKRNAFKPGMITIRNTDNPPIILEQEELGRDILTVDGD